MGDISAISAPASPGLLYLVTLPPPSYRRELGPSFHYVYAALCRAGVVFLLPSMITEPRGSTSRDDRGSPRYPVHSLAGTWLVNGRGTQVHDFTTPGNRTLLNDIVYVNIPTLPASLQFAVNSIYRLARRAQEPMWPHWIRCRWTKRLLIIGIGARNLRTPTSCGTSQQFYLEDWKPRFRRAAHRDTRFIEVVETLTTFGETPTPFQAHFHFVPACSTL